MCKFLHISPFEIFINHRLDRLGCCCPYEDVYNLECEFFSFVIDADMSGCVAISMADEITLQLMPWYCPSVLEADRGNHR